MNGGSTVSAKQHQHARSAVVRQCVGEVCSVLKTTKNALIRDSVNLSETDCYRDQRTVEAKNSTKNKVWRQNNSLDTVRHTETPAPRIYSYVSGRPRQTERHTHREDRNRNKIEMETETPNYRQRTSHKSHLQLNIGRQLVCRRRSTPLCVGRQNSVAIVVRRTRCAIFNSRCLLAVSFCIVGIK